MNRDDIIRMARSVGIRIIDINSDTDTHTGSLVRFAQAIAASEREACIKALEENEQFYCRDTIRARGKPK